MRAQRNLILFTDSYKLTHRDQYPAGTAEIQSYFEARVGARYDETVFVGLQALLVDYLEGEVITRAMVDEAEAFAYQHFGKDHIFDRSGWDHIVDRHAGRLPIEIRAVREGTRVPVSNVLMTVRNTDPQAFWLTNFLETLLSQVWYPSTVSTLSLATKGILRAALEATGADNIGELLPFMLHDFGCRGAAGMEAAALGGLGHLVHFHGTDTVPAIVLAQRAYGAEMPGFSVPASEHSTITSWGEEFEVDAFENMLERYPNGIVSVVSDSWDLMRAARELWGDRLRDKVLARDGRLVVRPDSGEPIATNLELIEILFERFGGDRTRTGHKRLHEKVRILQGDGMSPNSIRELLSAAAQAGWAAENWAFGMGGGLLQSNVNRDTQRFAFKCSSAVIGGERRDVFKRPATDPMKNSKRGELALVSEDGEFRTVSKAEAGERDLLEPVFVNGTILRRQAWDDVIANAGS